MLCLSKVTTFGNFSVQPGPRPARGALAGQSPASRISVNKRQEKQAEEQAKSRQGDIQHISASQISQI